MSNCWCGRRAVVNCVRCRAGGCATHTENLFEPPYYRKPASYGFGKDFETAVKYKGYWQDSTATYVCDNCRKANSDRFWRQVQTQSRSWPQHPFPFAMQAASLGYIYDEIGLTYAELVSYWLNASLPAESVQAERQIRPARPWKKVLGINVPAKPAEYVQFTEPGWLFQHTAVVKSSEPVGGGDWLDVWVWRGDTVILATGEVLRDKETVPAPLEGNAARLLVEMSRKYVTMKNLQWQGPPEVWKNNHRTVPKHLA